MQFFCSWSESGLDHSHTTNEPHLPLFSSFVTEPSTPPQAGHGLVVLIDVRFNELHRVWFNRFQHSWCKNTLCFFFPFDILQYHIENLIDSLSLFSKIPSENNFITAVEVSTLMTYENHWLSVWAYLLSSHYSCLPGPTLPMSSPLDQLLRLLDWCWEIVACPLRGYVRVWDLACVSSST